MAMSDGLTVLSPPVAGCRSSVAPVMFVVRQHVLQSMFPVGLAAAGNCLLASTCAA